MFSMDLNQIIRSVYDMNEPVTIDIDYNTGEQIAKGILFAFDVSVSYWHNHNQYNERRKIYVVLGPHKAWCAETYFARNSRDDFMTLNWVNVGNHDSCWINSVESWLNALYFNLCHSIRDDIDEDNSYNCRPINSVTPSVIPQSKKIAPNDCHIFVHAPMCEKLFRPIKLKFTKENEQYRRTLLNVEFAKEKYWGKITEKNWD